MIVEQYVRKSFTVDVVRVTAENFEEVAQWCNGEIHDADPAENPTDYPRYIKVRVHNPLTTRQTQAYVGDYVLYAGKGYKVYNEKAFDKSFDKRAGAADQEVVSVFDIDPDQGVGVAASSIKNPGGTTSVG